MMNKKMQGFSLIELLIAVLIIGIIASFAYPSYQSSVRKSNRAEAKSELNDLAQRLQRCFTAYGKFNDSNCTVYGDLTDGDGYTTRGEGFYTVTISGVSATAYTLTATAAKMPQTKDTGCTAIKLDSKGAQSPTKCW